VSTTPSADAFWFSVLRVQVAARLLKNGTLPLAARALNAFSHYASVQEACLWGVEGLLHRPDQHHGLVRPHPPGGPERGIPSLVTSAARSMRRFPDTSPVQAGGCAVLWRVASGLLASEPVFPDEDTLSMALTAMARWPHEVDVQAYCLSAVAALVDPCTGKGGGSLSPRGRGGGLGAPELVIRAMQAFPHDHHVQHHGCKALGSLEEPGRGGWDLVAGALSRVWEEEGETHLACCRAVEAMVKRLPVTEAVSCGAVTCDQRFWFDLVACDNHVD
jgi:hypothetical protein